MVTKQRTRLGVAALSLAVAGGLGTSPQRRAEAAGIFGAEPLAEDSTVALAQPQGGDRWSLVVLERLQPGATCWQRQPDGLVRPDPEGFSNGLLCSRLQSSSGYSLRAGGLDLPSPWRLRIEPVGDQLELQAFNPSLASPVTLGMAPLIRAGAPGALAAFQLNPGWSFQKRSYEGRLLSHVYLSSRQPLAALVAGRQSLPAAGRVVVEKPASPPSLMNPAIGRDPASGQVVALQVVPYQDNPGLSAANP
jgi:hypothetical protein